MTLAQLIERARQDLAQALEARGTAQNALIQLRGNVDTATDEQVTAAIAARDAADATVRERQTALDDLLAEEEREAEIAALSQRHDVTARMPAGAGQGGARVTDPEVYARGGESSFFRDLYRASARGDRNAQDRLIRNDRQAADQLRSFSSDQLRSVGMQQRALTTTDGAGGDFVPPLWLIQQFIELARAGRVVADNVRNETLPGGTDTISLPRLATGTAVAEQATQNTAIQNTDATTGSISAAVATIAGQQVISQQLLDQSPVNMDEILLADLAADYAIKADVFVINNNAANKVGILNVSSINAITYTDASPTLGELYPKIADAIQQVHTGRFMPPTKIFMHPRRWAWALSSLDSAGRPLVVPAVGAFNSVAEANGVVSQGFVGTLQGLPVYVDPNIPINLGSGTNEDRIIILRSDDVILFEGSPRAEASNQPGFANLSVNLRFFNYLALHAGRFPKSISVVAGSGLITPTF